MHPPLGAWSVPNIPPLVAFWWYWADRLGRVCRSGVFSLLPLALQFGQGLPFCHRQGILPTWSEWIVQRSWGPVSRQEKKRHPWLRLSVITPNFIVYGVLYNPTLQPGACGSSCAGASSPRSSLAPR